MGIPENKKAINNKYNNICNKRKSERLCKNVKSYDSNTDKF